MNSCSLVFHSILSFPFDHPHPYPHRHPHPDPDSDSQTHPPPLDSDSSTSDSWTSNSNKQHGHSPKTFHPAFSSLPLTASIALQRASSQPACPSPAWVKPSPQSDLPLHFPLQNLIFHIPPLPSSTASHTLFQAPSIQPSPRATQPITRLDHPSQSPSEFTAENCKGKGKGKAFSISDPPEPQVGHAPESLHVSNDRIDSRLENHPTSNLRFNCNNRSPGKLTSPLLLSKSWVVDKPKSNYTCPSTILEPSSAPQNVFESPQLSPPVGSLDVFKLSPQRKRPQSMWVHGPSTVKARPRSMDLNHLVNPYPKIPSSVTFMTREPERLRERPRGERLNSKPISQSGASPPLDLMNHSPLTLPRLVNKRESPNDRSLGARSDSKRSSRKSIEMVVNPKKLGEPFWRTRERNAEKKKLQEEERLGIEGLARIVARMGYAEEGEEDEDEDVIGPPPIERAQEVTTSEEFFFSDTKDKVSKEETKGSVKPLHKMSYAEEEEEDSEWLSFSSKMDRQAQVIDPAELCSTSASAHKTTTTKAESFLRLDDKHDDYLCEQGTAMAPSRSAVGPSPPPQPRFASSPFNPKRGMALNTKSLGQNSIHAYSRRFPSLVMPSGGFEPNKDPSRIQRQLFEPRTMYTLSLTRLYKPEVPVENLIMFGNSTILSCPHHHHHHQQLGNRKILIEIYSVALDPWDFSLLLLKKQSSSSVIQKRRPFFLPKEKTKKKLKVEQEREDYYSSPYFVPGRSFMGKILEVGLGVKRFKRGDIVYGLQDLKKSGALAQQILIDKDLISLAPVHSGLSFEQISCLPILGVPAYLIMSNLCAGLPKGSKILILNGHKGLGAMICELTKYLRPRGDLWTTCYIPKVATSTCLEEVVKEAKARGAREVIIEESVLQALNSIHESSYDVVIDTLGGQRIYDASRRILHHEGSFITCVGDQIRMGKLEERIRTNMRSLRRSFIKKDRKKIGYWCLSPETEYDDQRHLIKESLEELRKIIEEPEDELLEGDDDDKENNKRWASESMTSHSFGLEPVIGAIFDFEEGAQAFRNSNERRLMKDWDNKSMIIQEPVDAQDDQINLATGSTVVVNITKKNGDYV